MVPLPLAIIAKISLSMKLMAAQIAIMMIEILGIPAVIDGSTIYLSEAVVTVGNVCSGLRSLISLIFIGVLFAWMSNLSTMRKGILTPVCHSYCHSSQCCKGIHTLPFRIIDGGRISSSA